MFNTLIFLVKQTKETQIFAHDFRHIENYTKIFQIRCLCDVTHMSLLLLLSFYFANHHPSLLKILVT